MGQKFVGGFLDILIAKMYSKIGRLKLPNVEIGWKMANCYF